MIRTLKWVYKLGYNQGRNQIISILEKERDFHSNQAQIKELQEYEVKDDKFDVYKDRMVKPSDHEQRRIEVEDILFKIDPEKYPLIEKFMEMLR